MSEKKNKKRLQENEDIDTIDNFNEINIEKVNKLIIDWGNEILNHYLKFQFLLRNLCSSRSELICRSMNYKIGS
ncbi:MAG: hypothetical protein ACTSYB_08215 [Candidatus Helarchaeota archaeon]